MSFKSPQQPDVDAERRRLEAERQQKLAAERKKRAAEGQLNVRRQQRSPTVLTNPLGLGDLDGDNRTTLG
jgi:hypothetical protein